jgi:hypothetical protein
VPYRCFYFKTAAIDTPGGKRNLKMKIKAQQIACVAGPQFYGGACQNKFLNGYIIQISE